MDGHKVPGNARQARAEAGRLVYLDVLRAVAILSVMFCHLPPQLAGSFGALQVYGGRGVDLFFVLSGFLIGTTTLRRAELPVGALEKSRIFWRLRIARIWPLYFGLLAAFVLLPWIFAASIRTTVLQHPVPYVTFTSNYFYQDSLELGVLWSLALEEQFYLVVGIVVAFAATRRDVLAAAFSSIALVVVAVSIRYRVELVDLLTHHKLEESVYIGKLFHSTLGRMDQLALGLGAAVLAPLVSRRLRLRSALWPWGAVLTTVLAIMYFPQWPVLGHTLLGLVFVVCVVVAQLGTLATPRTLGTSQAVRLIAHIGKVSFGLYLFHPMFRSWLFPLWEKVAWGSRLGKAGSFLCVWLAVAWAFAALSYRYLEAPILAWARAYGVKPASTQESERAA
jgi:peptidoglycan/LPS O-acetylase OafA/YrhL